LLRFFVLIAVCLARSFPAHVRRFTKASHHNGMRKLALLPLVVVALGAAVLVDRWVAFGQDFEHRAFAPLIARDGLPTPVPPPPGAGYCAPQPGSGVPSPPNAVIGLLTIGGVPAPAGTLVTMTFNGLPGPSVFTTEPGGYRVLYAAGGAGQTPPCINEVGTEIGVLVNGLLFNSGVHVGPEASILLRFDVAIP
jgi:hypothetical protein